MKPSNKEMIVLMCLYFCEYMYVFVFACIIGVFIMNTKFSKRKILPKKFLLKEEAFRCESRGGRV